MKQINILSIILLLTFGSIQIGLSQKIFNIEIKFSAQFDRDKLNIIRVNDGKDINDIESVIKDNKLIIKDTFYGTYAAIEFSYKNEDNPNEPFYAGFFVAETPAFVSFQNNKSKNPLAVYKFKNAIEMVNDDYRAISKFVAKELKDVSDYTNNFKNIEVTDSIFAIAQAKSATYLNKQTEFFKNCSGSFYCLWYFKNFVAVNDNIPSDSLLGIFSHAFSDTLRSSFEANEAIKIINGKSEKKNVKAPDFEVMDINGKKVSPKMYLGSYVLIDFWASWCGPCMKELPYIREIRKQYPEDKLKMIFISCDKEISALKKALAKVNIDFGIHLFSTSDLINLYGAQGIPKTVLIDPNGLIIYNNHIDSDSVELPILNALLEKTLKH